MKEFTRLLAAWLAAAVATAAVASVVQTQINLGELSALGASIGPADRLRVTLGDLAGFGAVMTGIALVALLPAFGAGRLLARRAPPPWRAAIFALVAVVALWVAFWLMLHVIPMPAIAATRGGIDHALMAATGIVGGLLYARMSAPARGPGDPRRHAALAAMLALVPALLFLATSPGAAGRLDAVDPASYRVETVALGLERPWSLAFLPDGRMLVTEMGGRLLAIGADGASTPIATDGLPPVFQRGGTIGLMDVAPDPAFARNGLLYLTMGHGEEGANGTRLVRARLQNDRLEDVRILFSSTPKPRAGNNGGRIAFLPDGTLALTVGDGNWRREEAQNPANHLGTVVRLDRDGRAPPDNPFLKRPGAAPEVYSLGHRNPQGIAVDPGTGELLLTEHGARGGDEINRIVGGKNYGWPLVTAGIDYPSGRVTPFSRLAGFEAPLLEWTPSIAPSGLAVYDGALFPEWRGDLLVPALRGRALHRVVRDGGRIVEQQTLLAELNQRLRDVKVGRDGAIYVLTDGLDASLLRLSPP
ncbi:PQQ-dependent sugar dehydrogenase [Massilia timonae]|uniref:NHL repeat family protein n=1 Tax=Massilia timonae TaxID=47229 RepID=A0A1S2NB22_9BURK|nr:PQQ-dependent sugar dehydrogenase [Massilia timonae]OIJ42291.1 NHL repeat family protein [Massilia timonae]